MDYIKLIELTEVITKGTTPTSVGFNFEEEGDVNFVKVESFDSDGNIKLNKIAKISSDCNNALSRSQLKENDILFSIAGALGRVAIVSEDILPANTNQALAIIRLLEKNPITINFLKYYFQSDSILQQVNGFKGGVAQQNLSLSQIKEFNIPNIPLEEQQTIVAKLDQAFAAIDQAKANIEKNIANAKELFQSKLNQIFEKGNDNEWKLDVLKELTEVKDGTHDSPSYVMEGIPFITQKNITSSGLSFENTKFIKVEDHEKFYKRSNVAVGDILISMIGANRGMASIVNDERIFSIKNVGLIKKGNKLLNEFLIYFLKSNKAVNYIKDSSRGGAQEFVGLTALRSFPVLYPLNLNTQQQIVNQLDQLQEQTNLLVTKYQQKLANLEELKKSILEKAFKGELV